MTKIVSIIIPTYNRAAEVVEAIESALSQTYSPLEIIVVDDGSTDDTRERLEPYVAGKKITYIFKKNGGIASARNEGIKSATGDYILNLDSDDVLLPEAVETKVKILEGLPRDVCGVFADYWRSLAPNTREDDTYFQHFDFFSGLKSNMIDQKCADSLFILNRNFFKWHVLQCLITPSILLRSCVYDEIGYYDSSMLGVQDWDFFIRLIEKYRVAVVDEPLAEVRFWISGDTDIPGRCSEGAVLLHKKSIANTSDQELIRKLRELIAENYFRLAYDCYKNGKRREAIKAAAGALHYGYPAREAVALSMIAVVPGWMARLLKKINPFRGKLGV